jgi:hypothetical protein
VKSEYLIEPGLWKEDRESRVTALGTSVEKELNDPQIDQKGGIMSAFRKLGSFFTKMGAGSNGNQKLKGK